MMYRGQMLSCLVLLLSSFATDVDASEVIQEFSGTRSGHTREFEVEAPWLLDWRVTGEFPAALAIDVSLVDANTGVHVGAVLKSRYISDGVRLFNQGGRFQFKIDATMARWTLRVEQLSDEEAALYTPAR